LAKKNKKEKKKAKKQEKKEGKKELKEKKPIQKKPVTIKRKDIGTDARYIVRIANKDLDGTKSIQMALIELKGIGIRLGEMMAKTFEKKTGIKKEEFIGKIPEEKDKILEEIVLNPKKYGIPEWALNRKKDWETGENKHLIMGELEFSKRNDLQRLSETKSYRGLRLTWGLTVRGQKTKSTHRGKGGTIGVMKKDAKK
jgi:small subunit ribosomal protein S13